MIISYAEKAFDNIEHPFMIKTLQNVGTEGTCLNVKVKVVSDSLQPYVLYSPWNSPGQNTELGSLPLFQGIFPTQGLNPGLLHCRLILYQLSHKGSPTSL